LVPLSASGSCPFFFYLQELLECIWLSHHIDSSFSQEFMEGYLQQILAGLYLAQ
jgi:hypothetical protein